MASTQLGNVVSDINTTLNLKVAVGATSATIDSATDAAGVALPTGTYFLTIDGLSATSKEYIKCTLTSTALTSIQSVSPQGVLTTGFSKTHRKGALVTQTDHAVLRKIADLLDGTTSNSDMTFTDLSFTGTTTGGLKVKSLTTAQRNAITPANGQIIYDSDIGENYQYIGGSWSAMASGSTQPNASTTVAGKVEIATSAESIAGTDTGGTGALLSVLPSDIKTNLFTATQGQASVYGADAGGDDTYVVALTPTLAAYTTGQRLSFKPTTSNTGACTIDFGPGVKNIKTIDGNDPQTGVIRANGVYTVVYDGTSFILQNEDFATTANKGVVEMATDAEVNIRTDTTRTMSLDQVMRLEARIAGTTSTEDSEVTEFSWAVNNLTPTDSGKTLTVSKTGQYTISLEHKGVGNLPYTLLIKDDGVTISTISIASGSYVAATFNALIQAGSNITMTAQVAGSGSGTAYIKNMYIQYTSIPLNLT